MAFDLSSAFRAAFGFSLKDQVGIFYDSATPVGQDTEKGSLVLRKPAGEGELWIKRDTGVNDWVKLLKGVASSVDNTIPRFDGTNGDKIQTSLATIDDNGTVNKGWILGKEAQEIVLTVRSKKKPQLVS